MKRKTLIFMMILMTPQLCIGDIFYNSTCLPDTSHSGNCEIWSEHNPDEKDVFTELEYLTHFIVNTSEDQANISKRQAEIMELQANISQQQTEILKEQTNASKKLTELEEKRNFDLYLPPNHYIVGGFDKGNILAAICAFLGYILGFFSSLWLEHRRDKKEILKKVVDNVCFPLRESIRKNIRSLKDPLGIHRIANQIKHQTTNYYRDFEFLPTKMQDEIKDYFDQLEEQVKRFDDLSKDVGRSLHKGVIQNAESKGIDTTGLDYPLLPNTMGSVKEYEKDITLALLDSKEITEDYIKEKIGKDSAFPGEGYKLSKIIFDALKELKEKLPEDIAGKHKVYIEQNNKLSEKSEQLEINLTKFIKKYM